MSALRYRRCLRLIVGALARAILVLIVVESGWVRAEPPEVLTVLTEYSPPYTNYTNGEVGGYATTPVKAILEHAGYQANLHLLSWNAALDILKREPGALIYPMARTPEREHQYIWIGRLGVLTYQFIKRRDKVLAPITKLNDLKHSRIAVVRGDVRADYLLAHGFEVSNDYGLKYVSDNGEALQLLKVGRTDFVVLSMTSLTTLCGKVQMDCAQLEVAYPFELKTGLYLVANLDTPRREVDRLTASYQALLKDGTLKRITPSALWGPDK
ncbi:MAG: transporter substrate-binding domain-containing protein [Burkholderiales bacterium]|nr:transporter substrate-binding domain-containing protein [Burkholderiales bacterium]